MESQSGKTCPADVQINARACTQAVVCWLKIKAASRSNFRLQPQLSKLHICLSSWGFTVKLTGCTADFALLSVIFNNTLQCVWVFFFYWTWWLVLRSRYGCTTYKKSSKNVWGCSDVLLLSIHSIPTTTSPANPWNVNQSLSSHLLLTGVEFDTRWEWFPLISPLLQDAFLHGRQYYPDKVFNTTI